VVVGAGIAGLAAALGVRRGSPPGTRITVLEAAEVPGGKLRTSAVGGVDVDEGADSFLARVPEAVDLAAEAGLGDELVPPAAQAASLWSRGRLRPLPTGTVLGVPSDLSALARCGLLSLAGLARVPLDLMLPGAALTDDVAVGAYVGRRLGREVVERLVDPLLGGVYAGRADDLSLAATVPQLAAAAGRHRSLLRAARSVRPVAASAAPVFASLPGGLGRLVARLVDVLTAAGTTLRTGAAVRRLARDDAGWRLMIGSARDQETLHADAVVLAVPAVPAARLLSAVAATAGSELAGIDYASVAIVTLAYPSAAVRRPLHGSGFLVPAVDGRLIKAATYSSQKWASIAAADPGLVLLRCSVGRFGDAADLQRDDDDLVTTIGSELSAATGLSGRPVDARVTRWGGALPQYAVGHLDRVRRIRAGLVGLPSLALAGAAYDGVGIPACVRSGHAAADRVLAALAGAH